MKRFPRDSGFTCLNKIELMYERQREKVNVERIDRSSTSILFTLAKFALNSYIDVQIGWQSEPILRLILSTTLLSHSIATLRSRLSHAWIRKDNKRHGS